MNVDIRPEVFADNLSYTGIMDAYRRIIFTDEIKMIVGVMEVLFAVVCLGLILIVVLHTLGVLRRKTISYTKYPQSKGWNKRFYSAASGMIILLLVLMWILNVWRHTNSS